MAFLDFLKDLFVKEPEMLGFVPNESHENDPRNLRYEEIAPFGAGKPIPVSGDVERNPWGLNQAHSSSCTCHSTVQAIHNSKSKQDVFFSPRYTFKKIKTDPKYPSHNLQWGAYMRDSILLKINEGICEYDLCPNMGTESDLSYLGLTITPAMEENAKRYIGGSYVYVTDSSKNQVDRFDDIIRYMAEQGEGVNVGIDWRGSFNNARTTGIVPTVMPSGGLAGHAMFACKWKIINGHEYMGFRNSFGADWGDHGIVWLPKGFFKIQSAIAYIPPQKPLSDDIEKPTDVPEERNIFLEQSNAMLLRKMLMETFPLDVNVGSREANMAARSLAGKMWLVLPQAVTYRGWTIKDISNYLYAQSRNKRDERAYRFDFTRTKS